MSDTEPQQGVCKSCKGPLVVKPNMFYYRGRYFKGWVCEPRNALYNIPSEGFFEWVRECAEKKIPRVFK